MSKIVFDLCDDISLSDMEEVVKDIKRKHKHLILKDGGLVIK